MLYGDVICSFHFVWHVYVVTYCDFYVLLDMQLAVLCVYLDGDSSCCFNLVLFVFISSFY